MTVYPRGLNLLQKISLSLMGVLVLLTFIGANLHAVLWQSSQWLVSTVLPAVVVQLTNEERAQNDAAPLVRSSLLDQAAKLKADHMARNQYFAHYSPEGVSPWHWFDEVGYTYAHAGENLAIHFTDSSEVVEAWMNSPTHRKNIVGQQYVEIGVGTAKGTYEGYDTVYVVQLFGTPAVAPASAPMVQKPAASPVVVEKVTEQATSLASELVETLPVSVTAQAEQSFPSTEEVLAVEVTEIPLAEVTEAELPAIISESEVVKEAVLPVPVTENSADVVVIESPLIATSSGLAIAQITTERAEENYLSISAVATQPNTLLQYLYMTIGVITLVLLFSSIVLEARRFHFTQVAYGFLLLIGMGALWYTHLILTNGAVVI